MMNIIKNIFESLWRIILIVVVFFIWLFIWIPMFSCDRSLDVLDYDSDYMKLNTDINYLLYFYENGELSKLDKNLCYTYTVSYIKNRSNFSDPIYCNFLFYQSKLQKQWKKCFVYKLILKDFMTKEQYNQVSSTAFIVWNYDSWKKCREFDYEYCNMYITEKWLLKYNDKYKCE